MPTGACSCACSVAKSAARFDGEVPVIVGGDDEAGACVVGWFDCGDDIGRDERSRPRITPPAVMATEIRTQAVPPAIQRVREVLVRRSGICPVSLVGHDGTDIISDVSACPCA